jgi:phosphatidylinositol-3-phosphatase
MTAALGLAVIAGAIVAFVAGAAEASPMNARALGTQVAVPTFSHVVVIVFENKEYDQVIADHAAPTFAALTRRYALLTDYRGVAHPSLPNYLALVSGATHGVTSDCTDCVVHARNLADTLARAGRSWKTYAEGLPSSGFTGPWTGRYAKKHDPFLYFSDVIGNPDRLRRVVPLTAFRADLRAHRLPDFSLVVPDLCHDMHDCPVSTGDHWLAGFLRPLLSAGVLAGGAVFVVFDEGTSSAGGGGHVPALVLGPTVRAGVRATQPLDHYSLLRTIEDSWHLARLGRSAAASPITGIWRTPSPAAAR